MPKSVIKKEAADFARRLEALLLKKGKSLSPTELARDFNLRWRGMPLTVNATRKWLTGESIPTMDKITTLSNMLNSTPDWLRWGELSVDAPAPRGYEQVFNLVKPERRASEASFTHDFLLLSPCNQRVLLAIIEVLLEDQRMHTDQKYVDANQTKSIA